MLRQPSDQPSDAAASRRPCTDYGGVSETGRWDGSGYPVTKLSAAVLKMARQVCGESQTDLAACAGVAPDVVDEVEDGTRAAWALPYFEFTALADAIAVLIPQLRGWFETATACDLLLSCILEGDQVLATDVLAEPGSRYLAKKLLRWAITGTLPARTWAGRPLLNDAQVALLKHRAAVLAKSGSPDAWAGAEILSACCSGAAPAWTRGQPS